MSAYLILLDGDVSPTPRLLAQVRGRRVIAADGGIRHAGALDLVPELWLGDFDSAGPDIDRLHRDVARIAFPPDKDLTDGELAVEAARERGARDILLAGAFGGPRADHAMLHAMHALKLAADGLSVGLTDGRQEGHPLLPGTHRFELAPGTLFSIVGFTEIKGLSLRGVRWPLSRRRVPFGSSLTLSNVVTEALCVTFEAGKALLIAHTSA